MLCALTVRRLEPATFEEFRTAFMAGEDLENPAPGFVRFNMIRKADDPDEVICFGFFDGTAEELRRIASERSYDKQLEAIAPLVESVGADGLYEIIEEWTVAPDPAVRLRGAGTVDRSGDGRGRNARRDPDAGFRWRRARRGRPTSGE
jgi:heme-degrading monooxygenase HmoA